MFALAGDDTYRSRLTSRTGTMISMEMMMMTTENFCLVHPEVLVSLLTLLEGKSIRKGNLENCSIYLGYCQLCFPRYLLCKKDNTRCGKAKNLVSISRHIIILLRQKLPEFESCDHALRLRSHHLPTYES